jgi:hypothetical protein
MLHNNGIVGSAAAIEEAHIVVVRRGMDGNEGKQMQQTKQHDWKTTTTTMIISMLPPTCNNYLVRVAWRRVKILWMR